VIVGVRCCFFADVEEIAYNSRDPKATPPEPGMAQPFQTPKQGWAYLPRMDRTVRQHVERLEARLRAIDSEIMAEPDIARRNEMESEMRELRLALQYLKAALQIESKLVP